MSNVFISYAKEDAASARMVADALRRAEFSVWWDRHIPPGKTWDDVIGRALDDAGCVIVLWSRTSVKSRWVREEAERAASRSCLIPVLIEKVEPPFGFGRVQAADLSQWRGDERDSEFSDLVRAVSDLVQTTPDRSVADQGISERVKSAPEPHKGRRTLLLVAAGLITVAVIAYFALPVPRLPAPQQIAPASGTILTASPSFATLVWNPVPGARSYSVEHAFLQPGQACSSISRASSKVTDIVGTTYTFRFAEGRPGCWRVSAIDEHRNEGSKSAWWKFPFWWRTSSTTRTGYRHKQCEEFANPEAVVSQGPIAKIAVYHRQLIHGICIWYGKDGVENRHGYTTEEYGIRRTEWKVPDGERITRVEGAIAGWYLSRLQFFTDRDTPSPPFGGTDGRPFEVVTDPANGALRTISGSADLTRHEASARHRAIASMTFQFGTW